MSEKLMTRDAIQRLGLIHVAALAVTVELSVLVFSNAFAQEPAASPPAGAAAEAEAGPIIVTGSNIPTAEEVGPNPVFKISRDLIDKSGQGTTVEQLLKIQPVMNANAVPANNNGLAFGGPTGTASVSLRGFDPGATLVLIDGRRVTPFPRVASSGAAFTDLLTVPITAVQSIEILKDGASTTYGADAVAGVVNLKFYKEYRGAQLTLYYGDTLDKDAGLYSGDLLFGTGDDKVSIVGDIFFYHHNSMFSRDRGNSIKPPFLSSNASPYNLQLSTTVALAAGAVIGMEGVPGEIPADAGARVFATPPTGTNGFAPVSQYIFDDSHRVRSQGGLLPGFNPNLFAGSFPEQESWGGYAAFNDKICDDQLQLYGDFYYADVKSHDELAANATDNFEPIVGFTIFIPPHAPLPVVGGAEVAPPHTPTPREVGAPPGSFNPFNPFEQIISGASRGRLADFGDRKTDNENEAWLITLGIKGDKLCDGSWGYDGGFRYSQILNIRKILDVSGPRFDRILNANDSLFHPKSSDFIGQTTPYDPFNDFRVPIKTNLPLINFATLHRKDLNTSKLATLDLNVYTTDLFDLPGGAVGLALGGSFSRETYTLSPDDQGNLIHPGELGPVFGVTPPIKAGRKEVAFYAETFIPIFGPEMGIPGLHSLEFDAGARFEGWRNNDTNVMVPKVALRWQPFDEQFTIRSTWGEGFLEPSLGELFGPAIFGLGPTIFPPTGEKNSETAADELPNRHLAPEDDRTWTGGFVYTPKWIPPQWGSLTFSVDFWDVERTGVIMAAAPQVVINQFVKDNPGFDPKNPRGTLTPGAKVTGVFRPQKPNPGQTAVLFDPQGNFNGVASPLMNGGRQDARGVDLELQYQIQTQFGTFTSLTRTTYLEDFVFAFPGGKRAFHVAGRANNDFIEGAFFGRTTGGDGWMRWRGTENLDWTWKNWDLNWTVHYIGGYREEIFPKQFFRFEKLHFVNATWFTDASLSYSFIFTPPVESQPVAGYSKGGKEVMTNKEGKTMESTAAYSMPCWKTVLNNTTLTVGVNDIFGEDPPTEIGFANASFQNYPGYLYDNLGRFVYGKLTKKF